jgi:hypothetical protein
MFQFGAIPSLIQMKLMQMTGNQKSRNDRAPQQMQELELLSNLSANSNALIRCNLESD